MSGKTKMIHVRMPVSLVKSIDDAVKRSPFPMSRSRFIVEAVESDLKKRRYLDAVKGLQGMLSADEVPHWKDEESIDRWLSDNRDGDRKASEEKWKV